MSNSELAKRCGVSEDQINAGFEEVDALAPYQAREIGRCTFTRGEGQRNVFVMVTKNHQPVVSR